MDGTLLNERATFGAKILSRYQLIPQKLARL